jgi:hypothetical protein
VVNDQYVTDDNRLLLTTLGDVINYIESFDGSTQSYRAVSVDGEGNRIPAGLNLPAGLIPPFFIEVTDNETGESVLYQVGNWI